MSAADSVALPAVSRQQLGWILGSLRAAERRVRAAGPEEITRSEEVVVYTDCGTHPAPVADDLDALVGLLNGRSGTEGDTAKPMITAAAGADGRALTYMQALETYAGYPWLKGLLACCSTDPTRLVLNYAHPQCFRGRRGICATNGRIMALRTGSFDQPIPGTAARVAWGAPDESSYRKNGGRGVFSDAAKAKQVQWYASARMPEIEAIIAITQVQAWLDKRQVLEILCLADRTAALVRSASREVRAHDVLWPELGREAGIRVRTDMCDALFGVNDLLLLRGAAHGIQTPEYCVCSDGTLRVTSVTGDCVLLMSRSPTADGTTIPLVSTCWPEWRAT